MAIFRLNRGGNGSSKSHGFPKLPFFLLRFVQLLSCVVVLGVLGFFQFHLWRDGYKTPYEFSLLDFAASVTLLNIFISTIFICCCGLSAVYVIAFESVLTVLWATCVGLLLRAMGATTTSTCSADSWGNASGVRVCHMFKLLVAFAVLSVLSAVAMVATGAVARQRQATYSYTPAHNPAAVPALKGNKLEVETAYNPPTAAATATTFASVPYGDGGIAAPPPPTYNQPINHQNPNYYG